MQNGECEITKAKIHRPPLIWGRSHILSGFRQDGGIYMMNILLRAARLLRDDGKRIGLFFLTKLTEFQEFDFIKL